MIIGVVSAAFADLPLDTALDRIAGHGARAVELGAGGYGGTAHCDARRVLDDPGYAHSIVELLRRHGLELSALAVHGNPLHPDPRIASAHTDALFAGISAAEPLGVDVVTCFSGCPGDRSSSTPNWVTCPWPPEYARLHAWQWQEVAIPFWRRAGERAREVGVRLAIEMHPGMLVYNPATLVRLRAEAGDAVGANLDPSHLFWQGIDVIEAVRELGRAGAIFHVHAKDTSLDAINIRRNGNLDPGPYEAVAARAWTFRTVGYGHGEQFWRRYFSELRLTGYDGVVSIEHEDPLMSVREGIARAVEMFDRCMITDPPATPWWT